MRSCNLQTTCVTFISCFSMWIISHNRNKKARVLNVFSHDIFTFGLGLSCLLDVDRIVDSVTLFVTYR